MKQALLRRRPSGKCFKEIFHHSRQRLLPALMATSDLGDCQVQTEAIETTLHRFVFITKRKIPLILTYLLSLFSGSNCYLMGSQGNKQIIDELEEVQGDRNTVSQEANLIPQSAISRDGGVRGLVGPLHLVERFCDELGADQVHPRRLDPRAETLSVRAAETILVTKGGLTVQEIAKRNEASWRFAPISTARSASQRNGESSRGRLSTAPSRANIETCRNQFSINNNKLPGTSRRRPSHRFDLRLISPQDKLAGSQHRPRQLLADKPVVVGLTDAGCGVFANTSARINKAHQEERKMSYLLEASCSF